MWGQACVSGALVFSSQVYNIEPIKKAAYRCSDVLSVEIAGLPISDAQQDACQAVGE